MALEQEATLDDIKKDDLQNDLDAPEKEIDNDFEVVIAEDVESDVSEKTEEESTKTPVTEPAQEAETVEVAEAPSGDETVTEDQLDAELEATDKAYPEPIKKRIKREIRIRKRVEAEFEQVKEAAIQVAHLAQDRETELNVAKEQLKNLQRVHADVLAVTFDKDIQLKAAELRKARTDGDYDAEIKIQSDLDTLRFQQHQVREARRNLGEATTAPTVSAPASVPTTEAAKTPPPPQKAIQWVSANKSWFSQPKFAGHTLFARGVDAQLMKEGYDKNTDEYYKELDRRIDEAFPTLRKATNTITSPVAPTTSSIASSAKTTTGKRAITLTRADLENMRTFGLDPSNKDHLREYARNKVTV